MNINKMQSAHTLIHKLWDLLDTGAAGEPAPGTPLYVVKELHEVLDLDNADLEKEGRVLSGANEQALRTALNSLQGVLDQINRGEEPAEPAETEKRGPILKFDAATERYSVFAPIIKIDDERRTVTGHALAANVVDYQDDYIRPPEIWKALETYMLAYQDVGVMHKELNPDLHVVECYQSLVDFYTEGQAVKVGDWIMTVKVMDDEIWARVKSGELRGFSIGGRAKRIKQASVPEDVSFLEAA